MSSGLLPTRGYFSRMRVYLAEMFPLPSRVSLAALLFFAVAGYAGTLAGAQVSISWPYLTLGVTNFFVLSFVLRLMDELKDKEVDRRLFPQRPLPSGRVLETDIRFTLKLMMGFFLLANLWTGITFVFAVIVLSYATLMFKWFFLPMRFRTNLLLNVGTHIPIIPLGLTHGLILASQGFGVPFDAIDYQRAALFILMIWIAGLGWEICRKMRSPQEEDDYVTYTRLFGQWGAVSLAASAQTIALLLALLLFAPGRFAVPYVTLLLLAYGMALYGYARFLLRPAPETSRLRPFAEFFIGGILIAQVYGSWLVFRGWIA
jgi:4-hydroxybenzoate polyprenyltransferase